MTYHMESHFSSEMDKISKPFDDSAVLFPAKLFRAANAGSGLIEWSIDGNSLHVNSLAFEQLVMSLHPNLVEIPNFANFRRQMRAYGFGWSLIYGDIFEFRHNFFKKGRPDLLKCVLTRRKQIKFDAARTQVHYQRNYRLSTDCFKAKSSLKRHYHRKQKTTPFISRDIFLSSENERFASPQKQDVEELGEYLNPHAFRMDEIYPAKIGDSIDFELHHSCLSWFLQQDPMQARYYELDMLMDCLGHIADIFKVPVHFY